MSDDNPKATIYTYSFNTNDLTNYRDLCLALALRTLLYKSFNDLDTAVFIRILRTEADDLEYSMLKAPEVAVGRKMNNE